MSSSCSTRTLPAGCVCCLWPYSSPYASAGCTVRADNLLKNTARDVGCGVSGLTPVTADNRALSSVS